MGFYGSDQEISGEDLVLKCDLLNESKIYGVTVKIRRVLKKKKFTYM